MEKRGQCVEKGFVQTKVLAPIQTHWDGFDGYSVILESLSGEKYSMFGINKLTWFNLALLSNGMKTEVSDFYYDILKTLAEEEKEFGLKIIALRIIVSGENEGYAVLVSDGCVYRRIRYGVGIVLATIKGWPIQFSDAEMVESDSPEFKEISALLSSKQNPMGEINALVFSKTGTEH